MKTTERIFWFVLALVIGVILSTAESRAADAPASPAPAAGASAAPAAAPAASPAASPAPTPTASPPFFSGYLDGAAMSLSGTGFFVGGPATVGIPNRVFDTKKNGLIGNSANMLFQIVPAAGLGGKVELITGNDANIVASYPNITHQGGFDITQAFLSWTNSPGNLTLIGGKFSTLAGAEVIESPSDLNYSRSILFGYAVPFTHTGLRATYTASPKVTLIAGVNRGWDQVVSLASTRTLEGGLAVTPTSTLTLNLNGYSGSESTIVAGLAGPSTGTRNLVDLVASWKPPGPVAWLLNYDYGTQAGAVAVFNAAGTQTGTNAASWSGLAGYGTYTINTRFAVTLRGEYFNDSNGYRTGLTQTWNEATLTLAYTPNANLLFRGELRGDSSNQTAFITNRSAFLASPITTTFGQPGSGKSQTSLAFEAVAKF